MEIVVCLDENNGMLFNNRRQSRDKEVIADIIKAAEDKRILVHPFSEPLFQSFNGVLFDEDFLNNAKEYDVCFVENRHLKEFVSKISKVTVYNWNRIYPADFYCDLNFSEFTLRSENDICGNSHEKITKKVYIR